MNNQSASDGPFHSMRDWRQQGKSAPLSTESQAPATNNTHQYNGPRHYSQGQPQGAPFPGGSYQQPGSPGSYQQYNNMPTPGPQYSQYPGGPDQQYRPAPGPNQYPGNQNYGPQPGQYPGEPRQLQSSPVQPPFAGGNYQQYGPVPGPGSGVPTQPPFPGGQQYPQPGPPAPQAQPPFYQAPTSNGPQYQPQQTPRKRGMGWKALFFIVPVVLVVFASIVGPGIVRNMSQGKHPLADIIPRKQAEPELSQQQLQGIQQSDSEMRYNQLARLYVSQMTLDEEIGQLMIVTYSTPTYSQDLDYMLNQQHVGGVIMYQAQQQLPDADQVKHDVAMMQQRATFPLFVSIDEEGWNVDRLGQVYPVPPNPKRLAADDIHQTGNPAIATSEGQRVAHDMMALGINVNFAPDVDVATYHGYIDWDYRAFGTNPDDVLKYSAPYLEAMQAGGVIGTLKHFVGLGAVPRGNANDPHFVLPSVDLTPDQINTHLIPFQHFIQSPNKLDHPGFIMPTDLMVPSIDPKYPTEFSHTFITDILRNRLGYNGVVITDSLQMGGVQLNGQTLTPAYASVLALQAGCDMLLDIAGSDQVASVVTAVKAALQNGTLTKARLDEAATRIITLKMERNVVPSIPGISLTA